MTPSPRVYYWAPAPNRHLDPLLEALRDSGILLHEFYGTANLVWQQLGTPSTGPLVNRTILNGDSPAVVQSVLRGLDLSAMHLVHGMRDLSASVNSTLGPEATRFVMSESPLPRPKVSPKRLLRDLYYRRQVKSAAGVFAVSWFAAEFFRSLDVPMSRIVPFAYTTHSLGIQQRPRLGNRILFCGRIVPRKGIDLLLTALLILHEAGTEFTFDLVGTGPDEARTISFLEAHSIPFHHYGSVSSDRVLELMSEASVVAVPSLLWEGWGYVVSEALAVGTPVVASDIVGAAEVIVPGLTGSVFSAGDLEGLVRALRECLHLARSTDSNREQVRPRLAAAAGPALIARYLAAAMIALRDGNRAPDAPWQKLIMELGGNASIDSWTRARQGKSMPRTPRISKRLLRAI